MHKNRISASKIIITHFLIKRNKRETNSSLSHLEMSIETSIVDPWFQSQDFWSLIIPYLTTHQLKGVSQLNRSLFHTIVLEEKFTSFYRPTLRILITYIRKNSYTCQFPLATHLFGLNHSSESNCMLYFEHVFHGVDDDSHNKILFEVHVDLLNDTSLCDPSTIYDRTFDGVIVVTEKSHLNLRSLASKWKSSDFRTFPTPLAIVNIGTLPLSTEKKWVFSESSQIFNLTSDDPSKIREVESNVWSFFKDTCILLKQPIIIFNSAKRIKTMINNLLSLNQETFYKLISDLFTVYSMNSHFGSPYWCGFLRAISFYELESSDQIKILRKWCTDFLGFDTSYDCLHVCGTEEEEKEKLGPVMFDRVQRLIFKATKTNYQPVMIYYDHKLRSYVVQYWAIQTCEYMYETIGYRVLVTVPVSDREERIDLVQIFKETDRLSRFRDYLLQLVGYKQQSAVET
jgi:hypothetical protein